uniref:ABC transporter domain-containing protein n=1 Tax=viral metagenome TaxID=1070528 RepID=A0A6C0HBC0_9ZZZZ
MNIIYNLLVTFLKNNSLKSIGILLLSLIINVFQVNSISYITANIMTAIQKKDFNSVFSYFNYFIGSAVIFIIIFYIYKLIQNSLTIKLQLWMKNEMLNIILNANNENFSNVNFNDFVTPMHRISNNCYLLFYNIVSELIPNFAFLLMISLYFIVYNPLFGTLFLASNICIFLYIYFVWDELMRVRMDYETKVNNNDNYLIDLLNNMDKIILRGKIKDESKIFEKLTNDGIEKTQNFYKLINKHLFITTLMIYVIILSSIFYLINICINKKISVTIFITFFTILLSYRNYIIGTLQNLPDYLEFIGRINYVIKLFEKMVGKYDFKPTDYEETQLQFRKVVFENISFKYPNTENYVFENFNLTMNTNNNIIGIVGYSGIGKSTFMKMMLKLYKCDKGRILIDGQDIETIDTEYLRKNITYINQNSKLFDKKIIENILYGCNNISVCQKHLEEIQKYKQIQKIFKEIDIHNKNAGLAGENLSGGQRQVVNIVSGLINPCKILILDEPTNALDIELKQEIIQLIGDFKKYKQSIIIITHDKDVYPLFDEKIEL